MAWTWIHKFGSPPHAYALAGRMDVDLQNETGIDNRAILDAHGVGNCEQELFLRPIVAILFAAEAAGCNAIIAVDLDYETIGSNGSMLMVSASGTAVVLE